MPAPIGPSGPRPFSTHGITVGARIAVKRFRSHVDSGERRLYGDEPRREWRALELLDRYAPGLTPRPIRADLDSDPPRMVMSQVPGEPLGTLPATRLGWLDSGWAERPDSVTGQPVFAQGDPNLANHLWDGDSVHLVDFEASGRGDQATELADFVEHVTVWAHAGISAEAFLDRFDLSPGERRQITQLRRLFAAFWVMRLLPGGSAYHRNPPGTFERQASRLLDLLGSA
jgi:Phosphotransferase enzyme family